MLSPRTQAPSTTTGTDALLYLLFGLLGIALAFGSLAWLTGNLTNAAVGSGGWAPFSTTAALLHPGGLWPHLSPTTVLLAARVIPGLLTAGLTATGITWWLRLGPVRRAASPARRTSHPYSANRSPTRPEACGRA